MSDIDREAEEFLTVCVKAARTMQRLNDCYLARDLLIEAMLFVSEFERRMDEELRTREEIEERSRRLMQPNYRKGGIRLET